MGEVMLDMVVIIREPLSQDTIIIVRTRRRCNARSILMKTAARSQSRLAKKLWTQSILRNARRESSLDVKRLMKGVTTASVLSAMTLRRLLILMNTMTVLSAITRVAC